MELVLSLFPGIDILGRGFETAGFSVVTGPEILLGRDVQEFHVPPGRFDGVVGGPPCQDFSSARRTAPTGNGVAMLREFLRIVAEAQPRWFLIENVPRVPDVAVAGYAVQRLDVWAVEFGLTQLRCRHIQFGSLDGDIIRPVRAAVTGHGAVRTVTHQACQCTAMPGRAGRLAEARRRQGIPAYWRWPAISAGKLRLMVGNGVPFPMAAALAAAVALRSAFVPGQDCECRCGRSVAGSHRRYATAACRKRAQRLRGGGWRVVVAWP